MSTEEIELVKWLAEGLFLLVILWFFFGKD
jgi:hypothetical protein